MMVVSFPAGILFMLLIVMPIGKIFSNAIDKEERRKRDEQVAKEGAIEWEERQKRFEAEKQNRRKKEKEEQRKIMENFPEEE